MEKHAPENCPRCHEVFICKVNTIFQCDCMKLTLSPKQSAYIKEYCEINYGEYNCLCNNCLNFLTNEFNAKEDNDKK
jgi:hypothetical protein